MIVGAVSSFQPARLPARASGGGGPSSEAKPDRVEFSLPAVDPEPLPALSMSVDVERFRVRPGQPVDLSQIPTTPPEGVPTSKKDSERLLAAMHKEISELQRRLFSENQRALLFVFQGMDAAGKGGSFKDVFAPLMRKTEEGVERAAFKVPTSEERDHDFLWRIHAETPNKGNIGFFDRSHYEDIVEVRVQNLAPEEVWSARYDQVNDYERHQSELGTRIVKIFLHIGKDEQKERLEERREEPHKQYKFSASDVARRKQWAEYQGAYGDALTRTSTEEAPWYIVPADDKEARNLIVASILLKTLREMDPQVPPLPEDLARLEIV
ncbi:MAG: PPK2 family polyphosphate kinase [Candidatus Eremiobacterota bacterium]